MMETYQKNNKKPLTILLVLLLTSFLSMSLVPSLQAIEPNFEAKNLAVLNDVIGINTDSYSTSNIAQRDTDFLGSSQKETDMQLVSAQGSLRVTCFYAKDTLKLVYLSDLNGVLSLKQPLKSTVDMAKGLLERYKTYSGVSVYGEFASMLNGIEPNKESTKYSENVKMEVSGSEANRISYKWTYVDSNGVLAEKKNVILIFEGGVFKGFFNNWPLYSIVDSDLKVSAEQATELAIKASERFSYPVSYGNGTELMVSGFSIAPESLGEAKLIYVNSVYQELARGGDPFSLCLAWYVPLGFDRFYPGDVSGMTVILWADTGEVCSMDRVIVDSKFGEAFANQRDETADVQVSSLKVNDFSTQAIGISAVTGLIFVSLITCNKILPYGNMRRSRKFFGTLLCISFAFSLIFVSLPNADAASVTGRSRVYSCVGTQYGYNNPAADVAEEDATAILCNFVGNASIDAGYYTSNVYSNTINTQVVSNAGSDEQNYLGTIVFHAGHFSNPPNEAYQDSSGNPINASNIYPQTGLGRHFFVFLWVCVQAENHTSGTPRAWTHRDNLSQFGFNQSDGLGQCYISFYGFSPMLSEYVPQSGGYYYNFAGVGSPGPCYWFALKFYYYALAEGYSVHDSLDIASGEFFGCDYESTVLNTGYHSWWPGGDFPGVWCEEHQVFHENPLCNTGYYPRDFNYEFSLHPWNRTAREPNRMRVFGDSNIYLAMPAVTLSSNYGSPTFYFDGNAVSTGNVKILRNTYSVSTSVPSGYTFNRFTYGGSNYYGNPSNIAINNDGYFDVYFAPISYRYLDVWSATGGYTNYAVGSHPFIQGQTAYVYAYENSGYTFSYWIVDGTPAGSSNPIGVSMNVDHYIQPVFTATQYAPSTPSVGGPSSGYVSQSYQFSAVSTDANGDNIRYTFDWGDGTDYTTGWYSSGSTAYASHTWTSAAQYSVTVTAQDSTGLSSGSSSPHSMTVQTQQTYYLLTVTASDAYNNNLEPPVYIDGGYVGLAGNTFQVTAGAHTVAVHSPFIYWTFDQFSDGLGNGATRQITSNTNLHAWYTF
jgi:hypothetical protein